MKLSQDIQLIQKLCDDQNRMNAIFLAVALLFFWQWHLSSLAVGTLITGSRNALCILFPTNWSSSAHKEEGDESLDKQKSLELAIERLLKASVSHDIMSIVQNGFVDVPSDLQTELDHTKERLELCIIKKKKNTLFFGIIGLVHIARTKRPQPKGNTKNARVPSASKSSEVKKNIIVEEHHGTLLLSKNQKTMSSECNNIKIAIRNDKSETVCGTFKQCLVTANHDACLLSSMNALNSCANNLYASVPLVQIKSDVGHRVYFVDGLGHNLFLVGHFCDADLEVAFRRNTCFIRDLDEHLCPSYEKGKSKRASHPPKPVLNSKQRLHLLHMDLCGPIKQDISYLYVFGALCYPKNDREDIDKLVAKGDISFFIGYSTNSVAYRVYNRRTKKIMETMNVTFDELSTMAFEQNSSRLGLQSITSGQISPELKLTYASSTITPQRPSERDLDILFELLHNEYLGGRPSVAPRTNPATPMLQDLQAPTASMSFHGFVPVPTNSSNTLVSSHNVDTPSQQHAQQQRNLTPSPTTSAADNVPNAVFEGHLFVIFLPHLPLSQLYLLLNMWIPRTCTPFINRTHTIINGLRIIP
nr:integrase, catalytic region, zinc finger, CCHC-type, peptidase aspartic, catalytic [Tanacetum cinerariifolium]